MYSPGLLRPCILTRACNDPADDIKIEIPEQSSVSRGTKITFVVECAQ